MAATYAPGVLPSKGLSLAVECSEEGLGGQANFPQSQTLAANIPLWQRIQAFRVEKLGDQTLDAIVSQLLDLEIVMEIPWQPVVIPQMGITVQPNSE